MADRGGEFELLFKGFGPGEGFLEVGEGGTQGGDLSFEGETFMGKISRGNDLEQVAEELFVGVGLAGTILW